jgi:hypothetical protein
VSGHHARQSICGRNTEADSGIRSRQSAPLAPDYIMQVHSFVGAEEIEQFVFLRDPNKAQVKLIGELKAENLRLRKRLAGK